MIKSFRLAGGLLLAAVAAVLPLAGFSEVGAAEEAAAPPKIWIQISPVSEKVKLKPDKKVNRQVRVSNIGDEAFDFKVYADGYSAQDVSYDPIFDKESNYSLVADWIKFEKTEYKNLQPKQTVEVSYQIDAPKDLPDGGQYAVIFAETSDDGAVDQSVGMKTTSRVGTLIFADLGGKTRRTGEVAEFNQPFWSESPLRSMTVVKNTGNIDFSVKFSSTISTLFGRELASNTSENSILPETSRGIANVWEDSPFFGIFNIKNTVDFIDGTKLDETKTVLIGPIWLWITIYVIFLLTLILIMIIIVLKVRKGNNKKSKKPKKESK
ncbi:MAG: DUF916 domain-containing protein [Candidatus Nomurabacteria bacterium]|jgi:hypothetical protein|nr:DUF916 domain-containing protein [Candidatus Nomurabacteria bacterium]